VSILSLDSSISGRVSRFEIANPPSSFVSRSAFVFCFRRSCKHILRGHTSTIRCLKVLDGRPIAVSGSRDSTLRVWDIEKGVLLHLLSGHQHSVRCIEVAGNKVVSGSYDCTCRVSGSFLLSSSFRRVEIDFEHELTFASSSSLVVGPRYGRMPAGLPRSLPSDLRCCVRWRESRDWFARFDCEGLVGSDWVRRFSLPFSRTPLHLFKPSAHFLPSSTPTANA